MAYEHATAATRADVRSARRVAFAQLRQHRLQRGQFREQGAAQGTERGAGAGRQEPVVADAVEARRRRVLQIAAEELLGRQLAQCGETSDIKYILQTGMGHMYCTSDQVCFIVHPDRRGKPDIEPAQYGFSAAFSETVTPGEWYHIALTATGIGKETLAKAYLNGRPLGQLDYTFTGLSCDYSFTRIGTRSFSPRNHTHDFHGLIDEVTVYSRALTDLEIAVLWRAGTGLTK